MLACVLLVIFLALNVLYGFQNYRELGLMEERFNELEGQLSTHPGGPTGYTPEKFARLKGEVDVAREIVAADQFHWTHLLSRFEELVPDDVSLRTIQPDFRTHSVKISGFAKNISSMTRFIDNLLGSDDLKQVFLENHGEVESSQGGTPQMQTAFSLVIRGAF
jgi:hypothetical protein